MAPVNKYQIIDWAHNKYITNKLSMIQYIVNGSLIQNLLLNGPIDQYFIIKRSQFARCFLAVEARVQNDRPSAVFDPSTLN